MESAEGNIEMEGVEDDKAGEKTPLTEENNHQIEMEKDLKEKKNTSYFNDGVRRIDCVIAFKDEDDPHKLEKRKTFEENMENEGLELEYEGKESSQDGKTYYIKVHAPWEVLTRMAELLAIKMPIQKYDIPEITDGCIDKIPNPFSLPEHLVQEEEEYFTADFSREREKMFIINDKETFFTTAQRSMCLHELMLRINYDNEAREKFGIDRLVKQDVYTACFPLHDGKFSSSHSVLTNGPENDRHLLYESWARPRRWCNSQPLDLIRKYFGEKIGIYFAWLGFYTIMLIPSSIIGLCCFIYGAATVFQNLPSEEICDPLGAGNFTMCPLCDKRCSYWKLISSCNYARLTYLFDNPATVFFAGFMAIWGTVFLELWKRKQATIQYDWDLAGFELEEHMRPDFEAKCKHQKKNPITQNMEPYVPWYQKMPRTLASVIGVIFMICCVLAAVFGVIMYRIIIVTLLYASDTDIIRQHAKITTTATAALINLVLIMLLNRVYTRIAIFLTDLERPKTDSEYEDSFTFKMFLFQFINYYSSIFYIAFFKGRLGGHPGNTKSFIGTSQDQCDPAGCLIEVCIQLGVVMVGKQTFNNFKELVIPKLLNWYRRRTAKKNCDENNLYTRWEQDNDLTAFPAMGLFDEYLEMVIQYGFVTIFVAAFPLAPLFALLNNIIEIRLDAYKFVTQWQRPVAQRAQDTGIWSGILRGITFIAVLTNAFIIGWTSDFIPKLVYKFAINPNEDLEGYIDNSLSFFDVHDFQNQSIPDNPKYDIFGPVHICRYSDYRAPPWSPNKYKLTAMYWHVFVARLAFVIVFEHAVFFFTWLVAYIIPDVPNSVRIMKLRELHLAKEARYEAAFVTLRKREKTPAPDQSEPSMA